MNELPSGGMAIYAVSLCLGAAMGNKELKDLIYKNIYPLILRRIFIILSNYVAPLVEFIRELVLGECRYQYDETVFV